MRSASSKQIRDELKQRPREEVMLFMQRLLRFKKENKELMSYLLFYADDEKGFIDDVKYEMTEGFRSVNTSSFFLTKKSVRKVLRMMNKFVRYSGNDGTKIELILHFCTLLGSMDRDFRDSRVLSNLFDRQLNLAEKTLLKLHGDVRADYKADFERLKAID